MAFEKLVHQVLKKILLVFLGSGLLANAMYLYGLSYYEGLVKSLGFELLMFPIDWDDGRIWAYMASRELGVSTVNMWVKLTAPNLLLIMAVCFFVVRLWIGINEKNKVKGAISKGGRRKSLKSLVLLKRKAPRIFAVLKWFLIKEHTFVAFIASYFVMIFVFFVPLFICVWVYFPLFGVSYGESVGGKMIKIFEKELCGQSDEYWSSCFSFSTKHIDEERAASSSKCNTQLIEFKLFVAKSCKCSVNTSTGNFQPNV